MGESLRVAGGGALRGRLRVPSDKSITHRSVIFAALSKSEQVRIIRPLLSEDACATSEIFRQLGCEIAEDGSDWIVRPRPLQSPDAPLDCGNSGTTMRLMAGVLAAQPGLETELVGDASLSRRPMARVADPLRKMGAQIEGDHAPLKISGRKLSGISYQTPVASAQIKSCLLLAGLFADGVTVVTESSQSRDHTERMFTALGIAHEREGLTVRVKGGQSWSPERIEVPGDISSAAFWLVAGALCPGSEITLDDVGLNPTRTGILDALQSAGADLKVSEARQACEPRGCVTVSPSDLRPFTIGGALVPRLIDEIPALAVLATQCPGTTVICDAKELRVKETDRLAKMAEGLSAMGAKVEEQEDGLTIQGPTSLRGAEIHADGDHRIAMSFAIAGLIAEGETVIHGAETIATSYPEFSAHLEALRG